MDRRRKYTVEELEKYADRYISYFENKFRPSREAYYRLYDGGNSPGTCSALGFKMDCGQTFIYAYGERAWNDIQGLKDNIEKINDILIIGNAFFSQWRYFNHWSSSSYANKDTKEWFLILFRQLKCLCLCISLVLTTNKNSMAAKVVCNKLVSNK